MEAETIRADIEAALGQKVTSLEPVSGGDIHRTFSAILANRERVFVKYNDQAPNDMFFKEASGLHWLRQTNAFAVPEVLHVGHSLLVLEYIERGPARSDFGVWNAELGEGLCQLHQYCEKSFPLKEFGFGESNYIGMLQQDNLHHSDWASFYAERRLQPMLTLAIGKRLAPPTWQKRFDALYHRLPSLMGDKEPPVRLHGDLWSGNIMTGTGGTLWVYDPAVYAGHREVDIAMLALFGNLSEDFYAAYNSLVPLQPGYKQRLTLYQLYPLLVHLNLFGTSYVSAINSALEQYE